MSAKMPDLTYLDTLSNKELHKKCLECGLPNLPVTDSTRQVILRRLRSTISGVPLNNSKNAGSATKNTTPRRETIHSSKVTPAPETRNSSNSSQSKDNTNNNNSRRTIAATPSNYNPLDASVRSHQTTTTVSDVGSQSEDDDFYPGNSPTFNAYHDDSRLRRSVSLTKSGVLTTSYTREAETPYYEQEADVPQTYTYQRPQVSPTHKLPIYEPHIERSYRSENSRQPLTQTLLNSTSYSENPADFNAHQPMQQHPRNTYSGSAAPFNAAGPATSSIRQRQNIGSSGFAPGRLLQPTFQANTLYPQLNEFYEPNNMTTSEPMETDTDSEAESEIPRHARRSPNAPRIESPYLSSFSRQLDARKQSSPLSRPQRRANIANENIDSPTQQFLLFFRSLDQQYHIKFYFFLTLAVVLVTLIYVILTP